jgi:hypothetical protein
MKSGKLLQLEIGIKGRLTGFTFEKKNRKKKRFDKKPKIN